MINTSNRKVFAIDLFCGVGGLTNGLIRAGIKVLLGVDSDPSCEYGFTTNNKAAFLRRSIENLTLADLINVYPSNAIRLLAGCAPCQTFSKYNQKATSSDKRWWLLLHFSRLVHELQPELVTIENVPQLAKQDVFKKFIDTLIDDNYEITYSVVNCADYGIPQHRCRLVLLASKLGSIRLLTPSDIGTVRSTVRQSISDLPPLSAGEINPFDIVHQASMLTSINLRRIQASRPGGTWQDWQKNLIADCHKKKTGKTYKSVYGRMLWDEPAPTITTQFYGFGNGRFGHPEQHRAISLREGAILQSFPRDYLFMPPELPIKKKIIGKLIGNAVPVKLAEVIGQSFLVHVDNCLS